MGETKQYTGAELKAWREKLGKDEAWAADVLRHVKHADYQYVGSMSDGSARLSAAENGALSYPQDTIEAFRTAYRAALEAEEARQAAERAQAEPVCPEGVTVQSGTDDHVVRLNGVVCFRVRVYKGVAEVVPQVTNQHWPARLTRFAADFNEYVTAQHAEGDRQRKLDAVKAAEEAAKAAGAALQEASQKADAAYLALASARRALCTSTEAGQ